MTKTAPFTSPFLLGFDQLERLVDRAQKTAGDGYPPYNIEQVGQGELRVTLAVAGFAEEDLSVTLEDQQLMVRGKQTDSKPRDYLHRGIAARQFQKAFVLADGVEVQGATLENGLLHVDLRQTTVEAKVKRIAITKNSA